MNRLLDYQNKCIVLKQIQSNKINKYHRLGNIQKFLTVVVSAFITFLGFSGTEKISQYIATIFQFQISTIALEFSFNMLIFILFLSTLIHLLFQFDSKQKDAEKAIILLSNLINEIENYQKSNSNENSSFVNIIVEKYEQLTHTLSSNSDKEFLKAKKSLNKKELQKEKINKNYNRRTDYSLLSEKELKRELIKIIDSDEYVKHIIDFVHDQSDKYYLGGGVVRNLVWDTLHNYKIKTPLEDIDIIYFDKTNCTKKTDHAIEQNLKNLLPNIEWSVRNQARMHAINKDKEYKDIVDAVSKWPETASAILVKKDFLGKYKIIAPHGLKDLFMLNVRPTPIFSTNASRISQRCSNKKWKEKWPNLRIYC